MDVTDHIRRIADGGEQQIHRECRECGMNLEPGREACPGCGGEVAVYEI